MRNFINIIETVLAQDMTNPIKKRIASELTKLEGGDAASHNVPGFRQKSGGLNLASETQEWSKTWRRQALNDLPDDVASVTTVDATARTSKTASKTFRFLVFKDASGGELLAVIPKLSNNIYRYTEFKNGETLAGELGTGWRFQTKD